VEQRNVVLTGASRGIGEHIARTLSTKGMNLLLVARSEPELAQVAESLRSNGTLVATAVVDLAAPDAPEQIVAAAEKELDGTVHVLVNNAAVELQRRFHTLSPDEIEMVLRVDLISPIQLTRLLLPKMLEQGFGRIVNISSIAGRVGFPYTEAYAASKDGLIAFSRVIRNDYRDHGVSASSVILGAVKEAGIGQRTMDELGLKANARFMVSPDKVADAVVRAIEKDKAEQVVMPGPGRFMKALLDLFPGLGAVMNKASGSVETMTRVADHREAQHAAS
jgi:short-subunit dehydrogenase